MKNIFLFALVAAKAAAIDFCDGTVTLDVTYDSAAGEVVIVSTQNDNTWFGILLGASVMTNTEAIYFVASGGTSSVKNYYSDAEAPPTISADQTLTDSINS